MWGTNQFVLLQVESLQFTAAFRQRHHAFIRDTVALTQMDVLQLTAVLPELKCNQEKNNNTQEKQIKIYRLNEWIFRYWECEFHLLPF